MESLREINSIYQLFALQKNTMFLGYGVEKLISSIQSLWLSQRDLYLIGAVNVGKSSLFNALLQSDLGKGRTMEYFQVGDRPTYRLRKVDILD